MSAHDRASSDEWADVTVVVARALANGTRLRMLALLARHELNVSQLAAAVGLEMSHASQHLAILREAGLVGRQREGTFVRYWTDIEEVGARLEAIVGGLESDRVSLAARLSRSEAASDLESGGAAGEG